MSGKTHDGLPRISRTISRGVRAEVIERARDGYGHITCDHCSRAITPDQQITLNHKFQWQDLRGQFARDAQFLTLNENSQRQFLRRIFNDPKNLQPLHVACHREVDFGMKYSPEEEERVNRLLHMRTKPAQERQKYLSDQTEPKAKKIKKPVIVKLPAPPMVYPTPSLANPSVREDEELKPYAWLIATVVVKPEDRALFETLPGKVREFYKNLTAERLQQTDERIAQTIDEPRPAYSKDGLLERLRNRRAGLDQQLNALRRINVQESGGIAR